MNWEIVGALGEVIGGVAVIASLIYVSAQIRNTNKQVRAEAIYRMQVEQNSISNTLSTDVELLALIVKSRNTDLSELEEFQLTFFISRLVGTFIAIENAMRNEFLDAAFYEDTKGQFRNLMRIFQLADRTRAFIERNHPSAKKNGIFSTLYGGS